MKAIYFLKCHGAKIIKKADWKERN